MEFIFQISGHPKVGQKVMSGFAALSCTQKTGFSGKAVTQALHAFGE
jgi:hypothetical protein